MNITVKSKVYDKTSKLLIAHGNTGWNLFTIGGAIMWYDWAVNIVMVHH